MDYPNWVYLLCCSPLLILIAIPFLPKQKEPVNPPRMSEWDRLAALNQLMRHFYRLCVVENNGIEYLHTSYGQLRIDVSRNKIGGTHFAYVAREVGPIMNLCYGDQRPKFPKLFSYPDVLIIGFQMEQLYSDIILMEDNPYIVFNGRSDPHKDLRVGFGSTVTNLFDAVLSEACKRYKDQG